MDTCMHLEYVVCINLHIFISLFVYRSNFIKIYSDEDR